MSASSPTSYNGLAVDLETCCPDFVRQLARSTGCPDQARELAQDTWLKLVCGLDGWTPLQSRHERHHHEVRVIWGDYFKVPQFAQAPDTHDLVHRIMLHASKCKQGVARDEGLELVRLVNQFAEAFWLTKGVTTFTADCPYPPSMPVVYPRLTP